MESPRCGATRKSVCRRPRLGFHSACPSTILCQPLLSRSCLVLKGIDQEHTQVEPTVYLPPYGLLASTTGGHVHARHLPILRSWLLDPTHRFVGTHLSTQQAYSDSVHPAWAENRQSALLAVVKGTSFIRGKPASTTL